MMRITFVGFMLLFLVTCGVNAAPGCICTMQYDPVCGVDGRTYGNMCALRCAGVRLRRRGECPPRTNCPCNRMMDPVCGTDGRTYNNECLMRCNYATLAYRGRCRRPV